MSAFRVFHTVREIETIVTCTTDLNEATIGFIRVVAYKETKFKDKK
jgi:hypothetical protein